MQRIAVLFLFWASLGFGAVDLNSLFTLGPSCQRTTTSRASGGYPERWQSVLSTLQNQGFVSASTIGVRPESVPGNVQNEWLALQETGPGVLYANLLARWETYLEAEWGPQLARSFTLEVLNRFKENETPRDKTAEAMMEKMGQRLPSIHEFLELQDRDRVAIKVIEFALEGFEKVLAGVPNPNAYLGREVLRLGAEAGRVVPLMWEEYSIAREIVVGEAQANVTEIKKGRGGNSTAAATSAIVNLSVQHYRGHLEGEPCLLVPIYHMMVFTKHDWVQSSASVLSVEGEQTLAIVPITRQAAQKMREDILTIREALRQYRANP